MSQLHPNTLVAAGSLFALSLAGFYFGVPWAALGGLVGIILVMVLD